MSRTLEVLRSVLAQCHRVNGQVLCVAIIERAIRQEETAAPPFPPFPPSRLLREGSLEICPMCGSSMMSRRWWLFGPRPGCIQTLCHNYGGIRPTGQNPPPTPGFRPAPPPPPPPPPSQRTGFAGRTRLDDRDLIAAAHRALLAVEDDLKLRASLKPPDERDIVDVGQSVWLLLTETRRQLGAATLKAGT
jgi:hypothetical protein